MYRIFKKEKILLIIFGLLLCIVLFEIGLRIKGLILLSSQELKDRINLPPEATYKIMCLGESTTASGDKDSYPNQLQEILNRQDLGINFNVLNKGIFANSRIIIAQLEDDLDREKPDMVITMMGVNDGWDTLVYVQEPPSLRPKTISFLKTLNVYKLTRSLVFSITNRKKDIELYKPKEEKTINYRKEDLMSSNKFEELEKMYKKAIEIKPRDYKVYIDLGRFYRQNRKYLQAEEMYKKAIEIDPGRDWAYIELGASYNEQKKYLQAEEMYKKAIELNPQNYWSYMELVWNYSEQGKFSQAEEMYKKAIEIPPKKFDYRAYIGLVRWYSLYGKHLQVEEMLKKAIELNPENYRLYIGLGQCYSLQKKYLQAEEMYKKAIEIDPGRDWAYIELGASYNEQKKYLQAEEMLKKAIEINPLNDGTYIELGFCYIGQKRFQEARQMFQKAIELNPQKDLAYGALAILYEIHKEYKLADEQFNKANTVRLECYNLKTNYNYQRLKDLLSQRGIKLVCVQYPMRSIAPLKRTFRDTEDIIFVDNEKIFKEAVRKSNYDEYFTDNSAGDFGHCTSKGNRLLAGNTADIILRECFNKRSYYIREYLRKLLDMFK